jgi:hypothetical protein
MTRTLFKGVVFSCLGISGLCYGGIFLTLPALREWGWLLYLISIGLITAGMLPYRQLMKLQLNPHELYLTENREVVYLIQKKRFLLLPLDAVDSWQYIDTWNRYGIAVKLKSPLSRPVVVFQRPEELKKLRMGQEICHQTDLFFPYFSRYVCEELKSWHQE